MLVSAPPTPRRDRAAIATSIAIHCCVLTVLAMLPGATFPTTDPDERMLLMGQIRIEHRERPHITQTRRAAAIPVAPQQQAIRPMIHTVIATGQASHEMLVAREARAAYVPAPAVAATRRPVVNYAPTRVAIATPVTAVEPTAKPVATTAPAPPAPSPVAAQREDGIGNFGETYPASVEPSLRATLFAGISGIVVRITVDEGGHATSIEFVRAPVDAAQREELRTRLLAARFIPANCNGLRCTGTVELKN